VIIVVAAIVAVLTVPISGRSLGPLGRVSWRSAWMVWLTIGTQLVITMVPAFPTRVGEALHLLTFVSAAAFIWANRQIPGTLLIALGAGLNLAAIAANSGTMPASPWAWRTAGFATLTDGFENSNVVTSARLPWLGDVFAIPHGWPFANVFSIGDVIIVIGVGYFAHRVARSATAASGNELGEQLGRRRRDGRAPSGVVEHDQVATVQVDNLSASLATDHH
jgi:hypothetical protein